ncbi:MAG: hypothetical protein QXW97_01920 [Candidatus Pacearchaeota archaeon]
MKKREKLRENKKKFWDDIDSKLKWGFKGLQFSFVLLLIIIFILLAVVLVSSKDIAEVNKLILKLPEGYDYLGILAEIILFIAIPFLIGIKIGSKIKK